MGTSSFLTEQQDLQAITGDAGTTSLTIIKRKLNDALHIFCEANDWPWLKYRGTLSLIATYSTGTITLVDDTTDYVTTTGTWSTGWSPVRIRTQAGEDYLITWNSGNSRWELDHDIVQAESGVTYTLYKDTYALPARVRAFTLGWGTPQTEYPIGFVTENEMQVLRAMFLPGTPVQKIALVEPDTTNYISQVMVWPVPSAAQGIQYRGFREVADLSADGDTYPFPTHALSVFRRLARSLLFEYRGNYERAQMERNAYELDLGRLVNRADPTAEAQAGIRLDDQWFRRKPLYDDGWYTDGNSIY